MLLHVDAYPDNWEYEDNFSDQEETEKEKDKPTGDFTGRCKDCGSSDLWDDNLTYGCNSCGAIFIR